MTRLILAMCALALILPVAIAVIAAALAWSAGVEAACVAVRAIGRANQWSPK